MSDKFSGNADSVSAPARQMFPIVPHVSNPVVPLPKAIRCDLAGNVVLRAVDSTADVTITMVASEVLAVRAQFVRAAGTTATLHGIA